MPTAPCENPRVGARRWTHSHQTPYRRATSHAAPSSSSHSCSPSLSATPLPPAPPPPPGPCPQRCGRWGPPTRRATPPVPTWAAVCPPHLQFTRPPMSCKPLRTRSVGCRAAAKSHPASTGPRLCLSTPPRFATTQTKRTRPRATRWRRRATGGFVRARCPPPRPQCRGRARAPEAGPRPPRPASCPCPPPPP